MAQLLAPYHNGMRLGQGFNSYTQQICLDNAVIVNNDANWDRVKSNYFMSDHITPDPKGRTKRTPGLRQLEMASRGSDGDVEAGGEDAGIHGRPPWTKPQIVTYSSRFVDKLSDVTDSMNISGALSIQTATVGGKGSGSYVDSDKFKESDINFHLQVKVVNQILEFEEYSLFNMISTVEDKDYPAVYGDCFISGWEEGGEFNAIMSVKVTDKSKIFEIKAHLEASLSLAAVKGEVTVDFEMVKNNISKNTETTIAVNWSGGGSIKDPNEAWTIESMKKAAAAFPDLVAVTPQRTYAILTKYTALESFQRQKQKFTLLEYENAKVYTDAMLDHYMDYKMMWKQLALASDELEANRATIEWPQVTEDMYQLAKIEPVPAGEFGVKLRQSGQESSGELPKSPPDSGGSGQSITKEQQQAAPGSSALTVPSGTPTGSGSSSKPGTGLQPSSGSQGGVGGHQALQTEPTPLTNQEVLDMQRLDGTELVVVADPVTKKERNLIQFKPFKPTFAGLILASRVCRVEMAKIVNEVDLLTKKPNLAQDTRRDVRFLHPLVFKQLLPIVRSWTDDMLTGGSQASAPIILGYSAPNRKRALPPVSILDKAINVTPEALANSIKRVGRKAGDYRMLGCVSQVDAGTVKGVENADFFNDLESLDPTYRPTILSVWQGAEFVLGIEMRYANGESRSCGACNDAVPHHRLVLNPADLKAASNGLESIFEIQIQTKMDSATKDIFIGSIAVITTHFKKLDSSQAANYVPQVQAKATAAADSGKAETPAATGGASQDVKSGTDASAAAGATGSQPTGKPAAIPTGPTTRVLVPSTPVTWSKPDDGPWSLRGFFGYQTKTTKAIKLLGVVFGKDGFVPVPQESQTPAFCRSYFELDDRMQKQVESMWVKHRDYPGKFLYGRSLRLAPETNTSTSFGIFDTLSYLDIDCKLTKLGFANNAGALSGIRFVWSNGKDYFWGNYGKAAEADKWVVNVDTDLVAAKVTTGQASATGPGRIQSVEFIRADADRALPRWLLDISTIRYLGDGGPSGLISPNPLVDLAPAVEGPKWSVRGLYGWLDAQGNIKGLGIIWGCG